MLGQICWGQVFRVCVSIASNMAPVYIYISTFIYVYIYTYMSTAMSTFIIDVPGA